jgi:SHS2 domain-containing protein
VRWLSELLFRLSAENLVFQHYRLQLPDPRRLVAQIEGGVVNFERSEVFEEIKAVTYHQLSVRETPEGWAATVIFDV